MWSLASRKGALSRGSITWFKAISLSLRNILEARKKGIIEISTELEMLCLIRPNI